MNCRKLSKMKLAAGILFIMLGIVQLGLYMESRMDKDNKTEKMLSYMNHKYQEEFVFVESYAGQMGKNYSMILAESKNRPGKPVLVRMIWQGHSQVHCPGQSESFEDNYLAYLLKDELQQEVGGLVKSVFGECKVYYKIPEFVFPQAFQADMGVREFLRNPQSMAQFYIYPVEPPGQKEKEEDKLESLRMLCLKLGYQLKGTVSYPKSRKDYDFISEDNFAGSDYEGYEAEAELVFSMDGDGSFKYKRWL